MAAEDTATKQTSANRADQEEILASFAIISGDSCSQLINLFPLPLLVLNPQRQIVFCNKAFLDVLGTYSVDDFLGSRPGEALRCTYAQEQKQGCGASGHCAQCGAFLAIMEAIEKNCSAQYECQLLQDIDGSVQAKDLRVFVSPWSMKNESYYIFSIHDIGDEKRRRILEKIFFHDLLNTAGGARGLVDLAYEEGPMEIKDLLGTIRDALFSLVDEIMKQKQLVDVENGDYKANSITLQGLELLLNIADEYRKHPNFQGKIVEVDIGSHNLAVKADYTLLKRVLGNMVKNALEATPTGKTVRLGLRQQDNLARFWVHNPKGIPQNVQLQIFKRSFSTKGKGRGLGTYSIKLLTENYLNGRVEFHSTEAEGTTFWVDLPIIA